MTVLLEVQGATVDYGGRPDRGRSRRRPLRALAGVSLTVDRGAVVGVVGESGSGKSTLARAIVGLTPLTSGQILFDGRLLPVKRPVGLRRRMQMVFQDPGSSLNPSLSIGRMLGELLSVDYPTPEARRERAGELMNLVGLPSSVLDRKPQGFSGGQRQRIGLARALATNPDVLIADEPTSALDVSVQAVVLNLIRDLRASLGLTVILISHDLAVVRNMCEHVVLMYKGEIVERGSAIEIFDRPQHPYTRALLDASPTLDLTRP